MRTSDPAHSWTGVVARGIGATVSLGGLATLSVPSLDVDVNRRGTGTPDELDFSSEIDLDGGTPFSASAFDLTGSTTDFDPAPGVAVTATGATFSLLGGLLTGGASFDLEKRAIQVMPGTSTTPLAASLIRVTLEDLTFAASGDAFGLSLSGGNGITVAAVSAGTQRWVGVVADDIEVEMTVGDIARDQRRHPRREYNRASAGAPDLDFGDDLEPERRHDLRRRPPTRSSPAASTRRPARLVRRPRRHCRTCSRA